MKAPIPDHLAALPWYSPHQAWLREQHVTYHDPGDAEPRRANLRGANLWGADLRGADLRDANLLGADLRDANLLGANLRGADLWGADLRGADLRDANLRGANLWGADLLGANLRGADLLDANLLGANLLGADLRGANLRDATGIDDIPRAPAPGLAGAILAQIEAHPETHDQGVWHSGCGTRHCCAGWAVALAGDVGRAAEARLGTAAAARLLLGGEDHPFGAADDPLPWLRRMAAAQ